MYCIINGNVFFGDVRPLKTALLTLSFTLETGTLRHTNPQRIFSVRIKLLTTVCVSTARVLHPGYS
jgi:hypothetical protein